MNLLQFLKQVDKAVTGLSRQQADTFIHETARILPEHKREEFLERLKAIAGDTAKENGVLGKEGADTEKIQELSDRIQEGLESIEDGTLSLVGNLNEEYDDWYNSSADEFLFEDPQNLTDIIMDGCGLVHKYVDCEMYREGYLLFERLTHLEVMVDGDYSDYNDQEMSFQELAEKKLIDLNYGKFVLEGLYAAYESTAPEKRPERLYQMIVDNPSKDVTLEALMQKGSGDLPQWKEFLGLWIQCLGTKDGEMAKRLLEEALCLQGDYGLQLEAARKFVGQHPQLYEMILQQEMESGRDGEMLAVGQEALGAIKVSCLARSSAALLTAWYALRLGRQGEAELCWLEAFRSDIKVVHYLRLLTESVDFSKYREDAKAIYQAFHGNVKDSRDYFYQAGRSRENRVDRNTYYGLAFFDGEFGLVADEGMDKKEALGWSSTFMKCGIALFLLYFYSGEELLAGGRNMLLMAARDISFHARDYARGTLRPVDMDDSRLFWQCFSRWKKRVSMPLEEEERILGKVETWIEARTRGIMEGNYRKHYGECAAFIAALGEAMESRGERGGKARVMEKYRSAYSRRSAFHKELRALGMRDGRKK